MHAASVEEVFGDGLKRGRERSEAPCRGKHEFAGKYTDKTASQEQAAADATWELFGKGLKRQRSDSGAEDGNKRARVTAEEDPGESEVTQQRKETRETGERA